MRQARTFILGLVLLVVIVFATIGGAIWLWSSLVALPPTVLTPLLVAVGTVLVSVITVVGSRYFERRANIERLQRRTKLRIYDEFMRFWYRVFQVAGATPPSPEETITSLGAFSRDVTFWGSSDVVRKYSDFRRHLRENDISTENIVPTTGLTPTMTKFEEVLKAIRADLGNSNRGIKSGDIALLFLEVVVSPQPSPQDEPSDPHTE